MKELTKKESSALLLEVDKSALEELVSNLLSRKNMSDADKIDRLLFYDHSLHGNLDVTNRTKDKKKVMLRSRIIYRAIKKIDENLGTVFLQHQDDV